MHMHSMQSKSLRIAVIGAGPAGIAAAIKLREAGINDIVVFEKANAIGGTWAANRYPGLSCDVPSHLYRFSFAPNAEWTHRYAPRQQILNYVQTTARHFDVEKLVKLSNEVTGATYQHGQWRIQTSAGDQGLFDVVITAVGVLHHPVYPDIAGLQTFKGRAMHSSHWDESMCLTGKRVGIIGNGSTAIQILPAIIDEVEKVSLFQRTAQWVMSEDNPPIPEAKRARYRSNPAEMQLRYRQLAVTFNSKFCAAVVGQNPTFYAEIVRLCEENLASVKDEALRRALTPDYKVGCKRLVVSTGFYPAIQKPNAELVTAKILRIEPDGVRTADDRLHPLDVLVLATGFDPHRFFRPMKVIGENGLQLDEAWSKGNIAYRSISTPGFPNWFMLGGPNSPIGNFSYLMTVEHQLSYVMQLVELIKTGKAKALAAKPAATEAYNAALRERASHSIWASGCRSWYLDRNGHVATYPWPYEDFQREMSAPILNDFSLA
jgi:cation diffusion facilitator CzcD-associated flavoprotein CzcO